MKSIKIQIRPAKTPDSWDLAFLIESLFKLVEFWVAILAGPGSFLDPARALLADVVQLSSQKSASEARAKIRLNLVDFSVAVWAGPGCFLDPACALLVDVVQASKPEINSRKKINQI